MSNSIHGVGQEGAGGASFSSPQDGASGSAPVELPQEDPVDTFKIITGWLDKYGISSPKAPPSYGAFQLFGCQSPFSSGPAYPTPRLTEPPVFNESLPKPQWITIAGIKMPYGSEKIDEGERYVDIQISENFVYQGIPVSKGEAAFYKSNKQLRSCTLSENFDLSFTLDGKEYLVPAAGGERLYLHENGIPRSVVPYKKWEFNRDIFSEGSAPIFSETGQLKPGAISGHGVPGTIIQGYPISYCYYSAHENSQLEYFVLGEDFKINNIEFKEGSIIYLDSKGELKSVSTFKEHTIFGKRYDAGDIDFDQGGNSVRWSPHGLRFSPTPFDFPYN